MIVISILFYIFRLASSGPSAFRRILNEIYFIYFMEYWKFALRLISYTAHKLCKLFRDYISNSLRMVLSCVYISCLSMCVFITRVINYRKYVYWTYIFTNADAYLLNHAIWKGRSLVVNPDTGINLPQCKARYMCKFKIFKNEPAKVIRERWTLIRKYKCSYRLKIFKKTGDLFFLLLAGIINYVSYIMLLLYIIFLNDACPFRYFFYSQRMFAWLEKWTALAKVKSNLIR